MSKNDKVSDLPTSPDTDIKKGCPIKIDNNFTYLTIPFSKEIINMIETNSKEIDFGIFLNRIFKILEKKELKISSMVNSYETKNFHIGFQNTTTTKQKLEEVISLLSVDNSEDVKDVKLEETTNLL